MRAPKKKPAEQLDDDAAGQPIEATDEEVGGGPRMIRMVGAAREESVKVTVDTEEERSNVMDLLDQKEDLERRLSEVKKNYQSQIATVELQIESCRSAIKAGHRLTSVMVEEWLTSANEIVRIDASTKKPIGRRNASIRELQEELPGVPQKPTRAAAAQDDAPPEVPPAAADGPAEDFDSSLAEAAADFDSAEQAFAGSGD